MAASTVERAREKRSGMGCGVCVHNFVFLLFDCDSKAVLVGFDPRTAIATAWESVWKIAWSAAAHRLRFFSSCPNSVWE
jgi:hypothetical protein